MVRFLFLLFLAFTLSSGNNNLYAQDDEIISLKLITGDTILKEEGSPKYQIQIQSSKPVSADVNLLITFNSITAQSNDVSYTQVVKLDAGTSNSAPIEINAVDDAVYEDIETFYLLPQITLGPGTVSDDTLFFSIIDNEPPLVSFSVDKTEIDEDGGEANLTITLSRVYDQPSKVALNYEGLNFTAGFNSDFSVDHTTSSADDEIIIQAGDTLAVVKITAIDDQVEDPNENIVIQLNNITSTPASENISFTPQSVTIKINDDENPPVAVADTYEGSNCVDEGGKLTISDPAIGLLANDYDPENGPL